MYLQTNQLEKFATEAHFTMEELTSGRVPGIANFTVQAAENSNNPMTTVTLSVDIKGKTFVYVLQFLYTGELYTSVLCFFLQIQSIFFFEYL